VIDSDTMARMRSPEPGSTGFEPSGATAHDPRDAGMAARIVDYARRRLTKRSGDGECATLADNALRKAGARSVADYTTGPLVPDGDYVWGTPVSLSRVQPGDVIQFRDYRYDRVILTADRLEKDGQSRPHHTAIVESVGNDGAVTVLEQNAPKGSPIIRSELFFTDIRQTSGGRTTTITVEGTLWFYRPQPR
jgi:hypothetical protein